MITASRTTLVILFGLAASLLVGLVFGQFPPAFENLGSAALLIALIEWTVYFVLSVLANSQIGAVRGFLLALFMLIARFLLGVLAGVILTLPADLGVAEATLQAWMGNPIGVVLQMLGIMLLAPQIGRFLAPGLISEEMNELMEGEKARAASARVESREGIEMTLMGGFVQVFSFEELQSILRKSVGMEGFILYSSEGLVVWKDMPIRLDVDVLISRLQTISDQMGKTVEDMGLSRARKVVIESREHYIFNTRLNSNFGLIMVFSSAVKLEECWPRLGVMAKTVREFLQWKYSGLASLTASASAAQLPE